MSDGTCLFVFFRKKSEVLESAAFCISRAVGTGTLYLNRRGCTFTVTVIGAIVGLTVNLNFLTATAAAVAVSHRTAGTFLETVAVGFIGGSCIFTIDVNITSGTELVLVVNTVCC